MNTELNFPRRLLAGLTALALLLMLALPVWAEGEETEKLPVSINSVEDLLQLVTDCRLDSWSEDRTVDLNTDLDLTEIYGVYATMTKVNPSDIYIVRLPGGGYD